MNNAYKLVQLQALDEGLWFEAQTAPEAYLQRALRALHELVEQESKDNATGQVSPKEQVEGSRATSLPSVPAAPTPTSAVEEVKQHFSWLNIPGESGLKVGIPIQTTDLLYSLARRLDDKEGT